MVSRKITLKLLKLPANCIMSTGVVANKMNGIVMIRNFWNAEAPSTSAASYRSRGMAVNTPRISTMLTGIPIHMLTTITVTFAQNGSVSHGNPSSPKALIYVLIGPN
ncbi:hypothetical protein D3C73_1455980 [compost metagenome]